MPFKNKIATQLALPTLALVTFYWALFTIPRQSANSGLMPDEFRETVEASRVQMRAGKYAEALQSFSWLHDADPDDHVYLRELAMLYGMLKQPKEEVRNWEAFLEHAPLPEESCPHIGLAYQKLAMNGQALMAFERCYAFDHNNTDAIFYYALALERNGDLEKAMTLYKQGVST